MALGTTHTSAMPHSDWHNVITGRSAGVCLRLIQ